VLVCMVTGAGPYGVGEVSEEYLSNGTELLPGTAPARLLERGRPGGSIVCVVI